MTGDIQDMKSLIGHVATGAPLSEDHAETAFNIIMAGNATPAQMGGFLMALRVRGETVAEITGAANAMRAKTLRINAPANAIDTVGTGGDGAKTFNISSASAFVWQVQASRSQNMATGLSPPAAALLMCWANLASIRNAI